ncbi:uncharacterized protein TNCV_94471 [Trichonephila clavipes]|nr:uncharacterized protein TNCV_94471 [Trichonephila clavipes]
MPLRHFRRQYEQLLQFERGRITGMMEAGWSARRVAHQLGCSDCVVWKCWDQWIRETSSLATNPDSISRYDNSVCVWRPHGECLNPAFALQQHIAPTAGVMVWGAIAYNTRSLLVLMRGTMAAQRYVHDILQPHVLSLSYNGSQEPFFNKTMLGLTRQGCHKTVSALLLPFLGQPDLHICLQSSISGIIWDGELGIRQV